MIEIYLSDKAYENDVYPLVKAFYPEEDIKVLEGQAEPFDPLGGSARITVKLRTDQIEIGLSGRESVQSEIRLFAHPGERNDFQEKLMLPPGLSRTQYKNAMKRFLYRLLSGASGRTLPWGILTGIRPTKLVYELLEKGEEEQAVYNHMREEYLCSDDKTAMSIRIARREAELLEEMDYRDGYSLYIGIPFCPSTCLYCSFPSYSVTKYSDYVEQYLKALKKEIQYAATCFPEKKLTCVYFGGGTPTTLSAEQLDRLLGLVCGHFDFSCVKEFCVEAGRPDSITREKLEVLRKWGVDRISINPQSMQLKTLDLIGRRHTVEQVREAFLLARETGHENINMDIILGLPGEDREDVVDTLKQIKELNPESLTVHTLAIKRAARLNIERENYSDKKASEVSGKASQVSGKASQVSGMLEEALQFARENDYLPYYLYRQKNMADNLENIGYSRYGREGLYNILIMEEKQTILALGAGGMSKFVFHRENRIERVNNVKSVTDYINRIDEMIERKRSFLKENEL